MSPLDHENVGLDQELDPVASRLRSARPRLISEVFYAAGVAHVRSEIRSTDYGWTELLEEGYDPSGNTMGKPVWWRIIRRGSTKLYLSTFDGSTGVIDATDPTAALTIGRGCPKERPLFR